MTLVGLSLTNNSQKWTLLAAEVITSGRISAHKRDGRVSRCLPLLALIISN